MFAIVISLTLAHTLLFIVVLLHSLFFILLALYCLHYSYLSVFLIQVGKKLRTSTLIQEELRGKILETLIGNPASLFVFELTFFIIVLIVAFPH